MAENSAAPDRRMRHRHGPHLPLLAEAWHARRAHAPGSARRSPRHARARACARPARARKAAWLAGHGRDAAAGAGRARGRLGPCREFRARPAPSFPRKRESSCLRSASWIPAFAGGDVVEVESSRVEDGTLIGARCVSEATWLERMRLGFRKTSDRLGDNLTGLFTKAALDEATLDEIEEALIASDLGPATAAKVRARLAAEKFERGLTEDGGARGRRRGAREDPAPRRRAARDRRLPAPAGDPGRRRQRLGQDHDHRQARPSLPGAGLFGAARRRRHLPRRRDRAVADLGRPRRRADHRRARRLGQLGDRLRRGQEGDRRRASTC